MVAKVADYVNVMYAGKIVEKGMINEIFYDPKQVNAIPIRMITICNSQVAEL